MAAVGRMNDRGEVIKSGATADRNNGLIRSSMFRLECVWAVAIEFCPGRRSLSDPN